MKNLILIMSAALVLTQGCRNAGEKKHAANNEFAALLDEYYNDKMRLYPLEATANGDNRFNDRLPVDISPEYIKQQEEFYNKYASALAKTDTSALTEEEVLSYDILSWEINTSLESFRFRDYLRPVNQFWSLPLSFAQLGSGKGNQPFRSAKDYRNFLQRIDGFAKWCDTAIANMKMGIAEGITNPKVIMLKTLPQLSSFVTDDPHKSVFWQPLEDFPDSVTDPEKEELRTLYISAIKDKVIPSYRKLHDFIKAEYIPACRNTIGLGEIPQGKEQYRYLAKYYTTTTLDPDSIFNLGMSEVERIRSEMQQLMKATGYKGDLKSFFTYMNTDKKFFPFNTPQDVIDSFNNIHAAMKPRLEQLFNKTPKADFVVRQTEKFREQSASAEYNQGTADGLRPGVFYVPIPDAVRFNTYAMEDLFLHEAIPGHHYQNMLTIENKNLPEFRRYLWYSAYGEGWALYTESLGSELGLYKDPYQHFAALSAEMHRAIRLVVDVGMHLKGWTREEAIQFSLDNEGEGKESIIAEVERYISIPGQALSYKIGQLKIRELRAKAEAALGDKFDIKAFHDEILKDGCLPLAVLEAKMNRWIQSQQSI